MFLEMYKGEEKWGYGDSRVEMLFRVMEIESMYDINERFMLIC